MRNLRGITPSVFLLLALSPFLAAAGCGGGGKGVVEPFIVDVSGELVLPGPAPGRSYTVIFDSDLNLTNDNAPLKVTGTCGSSRVVNWSVTNVQSGTYYIHAWVHVASGASSAWPPTDGDYFGSHNPASGGRTLFFPGDDRSDVDMDLSAVGWQMQIGHLEGRWFGAYRDLVTWRELSVTFDGSGNCTELKVDGQGQTAWQNLTKVDHRTFSFDGAQGKGGYIAIDEFARSAAFVYTHEFQWGALTRGASGLPDYDAGDIQTAWQGASFKVDDNFDRYGVDWAGLTVEDNMSIIGGADGTGWSGSITSVDQNWGEYQGSVTLSDTRAGPIYLMMSPDQRCAAGYQRDETVQYITYPRDYLLLFFWR